MSCSFSAVDTCGGHSTHGYVHRFISIRPESGQRLIESAGVTPDAVRTEEQHIATTADLDRFLQAHQTPPYKTRL